MSDHFPSALKRAMDWSGALQRSVHGKPELGEWLTKHSGHTLTDKEIEKWFHELSGQPISSAVMDAVTCKRVLRLLRQRVFFFVPSA